MSLKAKLEAVIYASEEPVTLSQLAALFAADALEWRAQQAAAAAEQTAEVAGVSPDAAQSLPLIVQAQESLAGLEGAPEATTPQYPTAETGTMAEPDGPAHHEVVSISDAESYPSIAVETETGGTDAASETVMRAPEEIAAPDAESEAKRLARQRDREVKAVLKQLLDELIAEYQADGRGVEIREIAGGYRMATKPECHDAVRMFVKSLKPPLKLSLPALETLAVIAYKQPVTAPEVSEIRGVESAGVLGSLLARKLIATAGRKPVIGRPILYKTTKEFLLRFGLKDVSELPSMEEFEKMAASELEIEPEGESTPNHADSSVPAAAPLDSAVDAAEDTVPELESNSPSGRELAETGEAVSEGDTLPKPKSGPAHGDSESANAGADSSETLDSQSAHASVVPDEPHTEQEAEAQTHAEKSGQEIQEEER